MSKKPGLIAMVYVFALIFDCSHINSNWSNSASTIPLIVFTPAYTTFSRSLHAKVTFTVTFVSTASEWEAPSSIYTHTDDNLFFIVHKHNTGHPLRGGPYVLCAKQCPTDTLWSGETAQHHAGSGWCCGHPVVIEFA